MKIKKIILDFLVIIAAFSLFILWYNKQENDSALTTASLNQNYKIYLITKDKKIQFWNYINQGVAGMAELLGLTYQWNAPEQPDTAQQIEILNKAVASGADAILIAANDAKQLADPIKNAKEKGVKVIYVDTPALEPAITTLATNNYGAGVIAAENMISELEYLGIKKGSIGIIGIDTTTVTTMQREKGFRDKIAADGKYTIPDSEYADNDPVASEKAAAGMIEKYPDLVGLFATNEVTSEGAGTAIKANQNRIIGIGFDKSDLNLKLLDSGSLKAIVVQNPYTMGYLGMAEAFAALKGYDTGPSYIDTGVSVLRKR